MAGDEVGAFGRRDVRVRGRGLRSVRSRQHGRRGRAWSNWIQNLIYETGGDKPHNNVPPYLAAYVWKCTGGAKYAL